MIGGTDHNTAGWISYVFIHLAYFMLIITPLLVKNSTNNFIFGITLSAISSVYFLVVFITGVIFILMNPDSYKLPLVVQIVISGIYGIILVSTIISNDSTADNVDTHNAENNYIKETSSSLKNVMNHVNDPQLKKQLSKAYDIISTSPTKSSSSVKMIEDEISQLVASLQDSISAGNLDQAKQTTDKICQTIEERNQTLKSEN